MKIVMSEKSKEIALAVIAVQQAEEKLREALRGVTALDIEHGLGADSSLSRVSSADLLMKALESEPDVTEINAAIAFEMIPFRARTRIKNQANMSAAIRVLKKKGVLASSGDGMWAVQRDRIC